MAGVKRARSDLDEARHGQGLGRCNTIFGKAVQLEPDGGDISRSVSMVHFPMPAFPRRFCGRARSLLGGADFRSPGPLLPYRAAVHRRQALQVLLLVRLASGAPRGS